MKPSLKTVLTTLAVLAGLAWSATAPQAQLAPPKPAVPALLPPPKAPNPPPQVNMGPKTPVAPAATAVATPNLSAVARDDNGSTVNILPGTLLRLTGTSLANADRVHFAWPGGGADAQPDPGRPNSDTTLYVLAPQATFANTLAVQATVSRGRLTSQAVRFEMKPNMQTMQLSAQQLDPLLRGSPGNLRYSPIPGPGVPGNVSPYLGGLIVVHLVSGNSSSTSKGDDTFLSRSPLRNGWTVKSVRLTQEVGIATVVSPLPGAATLDTKVHWDSQGRAVAQYRVEYTLVGPAGMSPL